jgi:hypothetical protein
MHHRAAAFAAALQPVCSQPHTCCYRSSTTSTILMQINMHIRSINNHV